MGSKSERDGFSIDTKYVEESAELTLKMFENGRKRILESGIFQDDASSGAKDIAARGLVGAVLDGSGLPYFMVNYFIMKQMLENIVEICNSKLIDQSIVKEMAERALQMVK